MGRILESKVVTLVLLVLLVVAIGAGAFLYMNASSANEEELVQKDAVIADLETMLTDVGELTTAWVLAADVPSGKKIEATDLVEVSMTTGAATNLVFMPDEVEGMYYKVGMTAGTLLSWDCVYNEELTSDLRLLDIVTHTNPIGLEVGSFVDIRIKMPLGEDYTAISHRRVVAINNGVLKLAVAEGDILAYNSMLVDCVLYPGSQIYAIEYVEGGAQAAAETYYPINTNLIALAQKDPNLLALVQEDILDKRNLLDSSMEVLGVGLTDKDREDLSDLLADARDDLIKSVEKGQDAYDEYLEEMAKGG